MANKLYSVIGAYQHFILVYRIPVADYTRQPRRATVACRYANKTLGITPKPETALQKREAEE